MSDYSIGDRYMDHAGAGWGRSVEPEPKKEPKPLAPKEPVISFRVKLHALDSRTAGFSSETGTSEEVLFVMPKVHWEKIGSPTWLDLDLKLLSA